MGEDVGNSEFKETCYLILFFDVLGFSDLVQRRGMRSILAQYERMTEIVRGRSGAQLVLGAGAGGVSETYVMSWYSTYFSDSILIWTEYLIPSMADPAIAMAREVFCDCLVNGLPLRGGMAAGPAIMNNERGIYLGDPLIDAVRAEQAQDWAGIGVAGTWSKQFGGALGRSDGFLPYDAHIKPEQERYLCTIALDWPRTWRDSASYCGVDLDALIDSYAETGGALKWDRTRAFIRHSAATMEWWKDYEFESPPEADVQ